MPRYDFRCRSCAVTFEQWTSFTADAPPCPSCKGTDVERLLTPPPPVIFKGSGFYTTDSRAPGPKEAKQESAPKPAKEENKPGSTPSTPS